MLPTVKRNFPSDPKFANAMWKCEMCTKIDTINHIKSCPGYEEFRVDKNLNNDGDLVKYFKEVLKFRNDNAMLNVEN